MFTSSTTVFGHVCARFASSAKVPGHSASVACLVAQVPRVLDQVEEEIERRRGEGYGATVAEQQALSPIQVEVGEAADGRHGEP